MHNVSKICTKCKVDKPFSAFYKRKSTKDGFRPECRKCTKSVNENYRIENRGKIAEINRQYKERNKEKIIVSNAIYRDKNREEIRLRSREWARKHKVKKQSYWRRYYQENKEKVDETNKKWADEHKGHKAFREQKRRSLKKLIKSDFSFSDWINCLEHFNHSCCYCGIESDSLQQDHFIPLSKGGSYTKNNIVPACRSCNTSKRDADFFEWYSNHPSGNVLRESKILFYLGIAVEFGGDALSLG